MQRVLAGGEAHLRFGLAGAEMQMVEVVGNWSVERRRRGVDDEMVMAGVVPFDPGRGQTHVTQPEIDRRLDRERRAVLDADEVDDSAWWGWRGAARLRRCAAHGDEHNQRSQYGGAQGDASRSIHLPLHDQVPARWCRRVQGRRPDPFDFAGFSAPVNLPFREPRHATSVRRKSRSQGRVPRQAIATTAPDLPPQPGVHPNLCTRPRIQAPRH